jgi:hypothetical protein
MLLGAAHAQCAECNSTAFSFPSLRILTKDNDGRQFSRLTELFVGATTHGLVDELFR